MRNAHRVADVRAAEQELMAQRPDGALMQRAAAGLASACAGLLPRVYGSRIVVLAGSGDNGGDALYAGTRLARRGAAVIAIATSDRVHSGAAAALRAAGSRLIPATGTGSADGPDGSGTAADPAGAVSPAARAAIGAADLIIDGLLGIGGRGGLREPGATLAGLAGASPATVVAVDLPSGIEADTGEVAGVAVRADVTVTFGTCKPGLLIDPGASRAGITELIDIGLQPHLGAPAVAAPQTSDIAAWLPRPTAESDKYRRGVLGVLAGSQQFTGAAVLSVGGAIRGGAGMIRLLAARPAADVVRQHWPEAVITVHDEPLARPAAEVVEGTGRVQAWVAGPGMGTGEDAAALLAAVLATDLPVLVDADGLTVLAAHKDLLRRGAPTLLTPHAGELARLLGGDRTDIEARRLESARRGAAELGATVLLKGSTTVIAGPAADEPVLVNPTGTSWLATAGSGDVLSGLAGSLLAQGLAPARAAATAAYLHGLAARLAADGAPIGAFDLVSSLPDALRTVAQDS